MENHEHTPPDLLPSELGLTEYPLYLLSRRVPAGTEAIEWEQQRYVDGRPVTQRWKLAGNPATGGLPTAADGEAFMALRYAAQQAGLKSPYVALNSVWSLFRQLGHTDSGTVYRRFKQALLKWTGVKVVTNYALWDPRQKRYEVTSAFGIIDEVRFIESTERQRSQTPKLLGHIRLSDYLYRRLTDGQTFDLDFNEWCQLDHPATRRAYEYLEKQRGRGHASHSIEIRALLIKLGYARASVERYPVKKCRQLLRETHSGRQRRPAGLELLKERGYLASYGFRRNPRGETIVLVRWGTKKDAPGARNPYGLTDAEVEKAEGLVFFMGDVLGNIERNRAYYFSVWAKAIKGGYTEAVHLALGRTREAKNDPAVTDIRTSPSQYFTDQLNRILAEQYNRPPPDPNQYDLPLATVAPSKPNRGPAPPSAGARRGHSTTRSKPES